MQYKSKQLQLDLKRRAKNPIFANKCAAVLWQCLHKLKFFSSVCSKSSIWYFPNQPLIAFSLEICHWSVVHKLSAWAGLLWHTRIARTQDEAKSFRAWEYLSRRALDEYLNALTINKSKIISTKPWSWWSVQRNSTCSSVELRAKPWLKFCVNTFRRWNIV